MIYTTKSADETRAVGFEIAKTLSDAGIKRKFIALRGEMGVGKTALTSGFASYFGIFGVKSPTYTVVNQYGTDVQIYHFDMYRITDEDDLYSIGYDDYIEKDGFILVEWSENIPYAIPSDAMFIEISRIQNDECGREIIVSFGDERTKK